MADSELFFEMELEGFEPNGNPSSDTANPDAEDTKTCSICCESQSCTLFPQRPPTSACEHSADVCFTCLQAWITEQMKGKMWSQIDCPECPNRLKLPDVEAFADAATFQK